VSLAHLGFGPDLAAAFEPHAAGGLMPGRVAVEHRGALILYGPDGETWADVPGRLRHRAESSADLPAVGDWVAYRPSAGAGRAAVAAVLPRRTAFVRKTAGFESVGQVVAANIDVVLCVTAIVDDLSAQRLERYLTLAWESGAEPVCVLTKADLSADAEAAAALVSSVTFGVPVHIVSAVTGDGVDGLAALLTEGRTAALVGSSGVGKSTLVNRLCGRDRQATAEVREDGRGRHTTTRRELVLLPSGGCLIDTPGMRELTLWDAQEGLGQAFEDVEELAAACRFSDCGHRTEPGCAVRTAIAAGTLPAGRLESFRQLERELRYLETRHDARARSEQGKRWRALSKEQRARTRQERRSP
jgi:ribosome biogenesis GTPase / thiamine phosphate phosphatase